MAVDKVYHLDEKLKDGVNYFYKIRAIDKDRLEGEYSPVVEGFTKKTPVKVMEFKWADESGKAVLSW